MGEHTSVLLRLRSCLAGIVGTVYVDIHSAKFGFWLWLVGEATVDGLLRNCK